MTSLQFTSPHLDATRNSEAVSVRLVVRYGGLEGVKFLKSPLSQTVSLRDNWILPFFTL
jgi:hypothetical protein